MQESTTIKPISERDAEGSVKRVFAEIKEALGVDEVPLFYRVIARLPVYLETTWSRVQFTLLEDRALTAKTKWMVALAISASNNNKPMILESSTRLKRLGASDQEIAELMAVVDAINGMNKAYKAAGIRG